MAVNAGEVSVALTLDSADLSAGLTAAQASLESFAQELATLTIPPEISGLEMIGANLNVEPQFAAAGALAGAAFGTSVGTSAALALSAAGASVASAGSQLALSFSTAAGAGAVSAAAAGSQLARSFASAIGAGAPQASAGAASMAGAAVRAAQSRMSSASAAGRAFASGLASGIRSGQSGVIAAAIAVASAAAAAARSALAIHSPSKVTRELGEYFDLGFIRGVDKMRPDIERSVRAAVQVEPSADVALGAVREAPGVERAPASSIDYEALADAMNQRQMVLTMDNRRLAQVQERETARAQSLRNRRIALGYGK